MSDEWPKIHTRRVTAISPWISLIAREVEFAPDAAPETYHAVKQPDYVAIVARTPEGWFPLVRQFRPAVEAFTWELPAGTVDGDEDPAVSAKRELLEETGFPALHLHPLGTTAPCTGRLSNRQHCFFATTGERSATFLPEAGLSVELVTLERLIAMIRSGAFSHQLHIGAILQAGLQGHLDLAPFLPDAGEVATRGS